MNKVFESLHGAGGEVTEPEVPPGRAAPAVERLVVHSFNDSKGRCWTACCECNRGGNGNDQDKCSCGWKCTEWNGRGCFLGTAIVGYPPKLKKASRSKQRYQRFLEYGDCFNSFREFLSWDSEPERSWNGGSA